MNDNDYLTIQQRIGYTFRNPDLLQQAFVRRSYAKENGGEDNEVLEFIGDKVLDFIIVKLLATKYGAFASEFDDFDNESDWDEFVCEYRESKLTELKKNLVKKETLAQCIEALKLEEYLIMGNGDRNNQVQNEASVKEDLFEAIIGAVALDCDWCISEMQGVIEYMLRLEIFFSESNEQDFVGMLQEWSLKEHGILPSIRIDSASYQNEQFYHSRDLQECIHSEKTLIVNVQEFSKTHYCCDVKLEDVDVVFHGLARSKSDARKIACWKAYQYLVDNDLLFTIRDEIQDPTPEKAINQLETLARRGYFALPTYSFEETHDSNGNPVWHCECSIEGKDDYYWAELSSKKAAKKEAAYGMLLHVLGIEEVD